MTNHLSSIAAIAMQELSACTPEYRAAREMRRETREMRRATERQVQQKIPTFALP